VRVVSPNKSISVGTKSHRWRIAPGSFKAYAFAVSIVLAAAALRWTFGFFAFRLQAFTTFYPAVLLATLMSGAGTGSLALVLSAAIGWVYFLTPYTGPLPLSVGVEINLITFVIASAIIVWATEHYRQLTARLKDQERLRQLAVDELTHRLKHKVATVQSIITFELRDHPELKQKISSRLAGLIATDDLISDAQGRGAYIRDILYTELRPYDLSRILSRDKTYCDLPQAVDRLREAQFGE